MREKEHSPIRLTAIGTKGVTEELTHTHPSSGVQLPQDTRRHSTGWLLRGFSLGGSASPLPPRTGPKLAVTPVLASGRNTDNSAPQDCSKHAGLGWQATGDTWAEHLVYSQGDQRPGSRLKARHFPKKGSTQALLHTPGPELHTQHAFH